MKLTTYAPSRELQSFIKCYYLSESEYTKQIEDVFFADGCVEVVFHLGLDFYRGDVKESWAKVIGQITQPLTMRAKGTGKSFGIWFWPHTFSLFTGIPVNEFNDKAISLDNIFERSFIDFVKNAVYENDMECLIKGVNAYLVSRLEIPSNTFRASVAAYAVQHILTERAFTDLSKLAQDCNITTRNLQKIFRDKIGFSPKFFMRIARFQYALQNLARCPIDSLTALTYRAGYYDQAHFIREFKEFTGMTPSQFHLAKHPINQYFLSL